MSTNKAGADAGIFERGVLTQGTGGVQNICPDTNALIGKNKGGVRTATA